MGDTRQSDVRHLTRLSHTRTNINDGHYLTYKYLFADLEKATAAYASGRVLDIGCGNKPYLNWFTPRATQYLGCDIVQSDQNRVDIISAATDLPLRENTVDTVFSTQVIEHVADHRKLLAEAFRVLKPGGYLILSAPMCWEHHEVPHDFFRFTRYGWQHLLTLTGFITREITANGGKWALVGQMLLNSIHSSFLHRGLRRSVLRRVYSVLRIKWLVNVTFAWLDTADKDEIATLNFVVVAQKPKVIADVAEPCSPNQAMTTSSISRRA